MLCKLITLLLNALILTHSTSVLSLALIVMELISFDTISYYCRFLTLYRGRASLLILYEIMFAFTFNLYIHDLLLK